MSYSLIRPAKDDDGPAIKALIATIFEDYNNCFFVDEEFPALAHPQSYYTALGGRMWVAEEAGEIVGCLAVGETTVEGLFEFFKVYVAKKARGQGLAWSMFNLALDLIDERGGHSIRLWTDTKFKEGHAFYEKVGFERVPVVRFLGDASDSWEYCYRLEARKS